MDKKYFGDYGWLNWIRSTQYDEELWSYVGLERDENGEPWDIIYNSKTHEYAYTWILIRRNEEYILDM